MNSNHLLSEPPLLQNKTFLRSILRDPDLKRRTMHACKHGVCRHRHTNTYTHACTHTHTHTYTRAHISRPKEEISSLVERIFASPASRGNTKRSERSGGREKVSASRSIFLPTDRSIRAIERNIEHRWFLRTVS